MKTQYPTLLSSKVHNFTKSYFDDKSDYERCLLKAQEELLLMQQKLYHSGRKVILIFEGHDAAGKGGVIRRMTEYLDPRGVAVHAIGPPDAIEIKQHYMERFFSRLPRPSTITIFDRSWYGRVLVERIEKLCPEAAHRRAYREITAVEKMLVDDGIIILKYLLDISHSEQKKRFEERAKSPLKAWKLTNEDMRNRKKWNEYHVAFKDVIKRTHTREAPWLVIAADSKWYTRLMVIRDVNKCLRTQLK